MYDSSLINKNYLLTELTCQEKKSVINVQDTKHDLKQKHAVHHHHQHCCQQAARPREDVQVLARHIKMSGRLLY